MGREEKVRKGLILANLIYLVTIPPLAYLAEGWGLALVAILSLGVGDALILSREAGPGRLM